MSPDFAMVERFTRWRYWPYRPGCLLRVQFYGGKRGKNWSESWRIACGAHNADHAEWIKGDKKRRRPGYWRDEVGDMEGLVRAMCRVARRAADPMLACNIAVAPALFKADAETMSKAEIDSWLGFGIDFDNAVPEKGRVGPLEGLGRIREAGLHPRAVVFTGSTWINGHGAEPKAHALFSWDPPLAQDNLTRGEAVVRELTLTLGGDPACAECARILRLPGSVHPADFDKSGQMIGEANLCRLQYIFDEDMY